MDITKWEYVAADKKDVEAYGKKGWEAYGYDEQNCQILLKRPCSRLHVIEKVNGVEINSTQTQVPNSVDYER